jgi:lipopolysaccharide transport system permease protein
VTPGLATRLRQLATPSAEPTLVVIRPRRRTPLLPADLLHSRELVYFLTLRDIKVRYKQTALGVAWAVLQPLLTMVVFTVFFGRLAKVPSDGVPYSVFALCGLVPWIFFANTLQAAALSLVTNANLVSRIYFPRIAVPIAAAAAGLVDLLISLVVLGAYAAFTGLVISPRLLLLPVLVLLSGSAVLGIGSWLAALNVTYRDVRHAVPFLIQLWLIVTPVAYPSSLLAEPWRSVYALNPMAGVVEGFRWALLDVPGAGLPRLLAISGASTVLLLLYGLFAFHRREPAFADVV